MRFIGNQHAIHFGGVTFVNHVALVNMVIRELIAANKPAALQEEMTDILNQVVRRMEQELRDELRQKHYDADLALPADASEK